MFYDQLVRTLFHNEQRDCVDRSHSLVSRRYAIHVISTARKLFDKQENKPCPCVNSFTSEVVGLCTDLLSCMDYMMILDSLYN